MKLTSTGVQSTVGSGSGFTGLAVDAGGNVLATTGTTLQEYPAGGGTAITLPNTFTSAKSLALDASGNALVADSGTNSFVQIQRTAGYYKFTSSPASTTLFVTNSGNQSVTTPTYTQSDSTDFSLAGATTNGCSGALAVGTECGLSASFAPTTAGTLIDNVTVNSNAANASAITITLTGTTAAQSTTTSLRVSPATLVYGNVETLTATVTGSLQAPSNGTVNFYNNGSSTAFASASVTSGTATYSFVPPAGSYSVTANYVPSGLTYSGSSSSPAQTFSVTPASLTVTANDASKIYGSANPTFTYSITGFVNNDTQSGAVMGAPVETTTANTNSSVGTYPINITQGTLAAANYNFTFANGTLTVSGATSQTITFGPLPNMTYGVTPTTLTATASSGLAVSYTVTGPATVSGSTLTITGAGNVSVTANQTGNNTYAAAAGVTQSFTVSPAVLTVSVGTETKTYGSANPPLLYGITGFVNSDTRVTATTGSPNESTTATTSSGVGSYTIAITQGTLAATNYTFSFTNGSLSVTPAQLTITANNTTRAYGTANPTLSGTLSGAVNNDQLTETFTTTATVASPAGTYAIVPGFTGTNAANYSATGTTTNGTLTITQVKPGITLVASPMSGFSGATSISLTATLTAPYGSPTGMVTFYSGSASVGMATVTNGVAAISLTNLPVGPDTLSATYNGDTNFTIATSNAATVTIAAGFGVTSSSTTFTFQGSYQEAQAFLTINPGGRTDTLTFSCAGLPSKLSCAFNPTTLPLSGLTTPQTVQVLISNSNASASLRSERGLAGGAARGVALAMLPMGTIMLIGLRRRRSLPMLLLVSFLSIGAVFGLSGCGTSPSSVRQPSGTYSFTINITSGSTTLQSIPCTIVVP